MPSLSGRKTVTAAGTPEPLGDQAANAPVLIKALATNTGAVYIGGSALTGLPLVAGEQVTFEFIGHLAGLPLDAAVSGEGVAWLILNA